MATPATGAISFSDLRGEIMQSGSGAISLNTAAARLGFGSTSQVSISELRKCYGATITAGTQNVSGKGFDFTFDGYIVSTIGSIDNDVLTSGQVLEAAYTFYDFGVLQATVLEFSFPSTSGFESTNVNRVATANTTRTISSTSSDEVFLATSYVFPSSGTVTIGIRWNI